MAKLRIDAQPNGDRWEVQVAGELDAATAGQLTDYLQDAPPGATVVLDLVSLMFLDSSGLRAIIRAHLAGPGLVVENPRPEILRVLEIAGVLDDLGIEPRAS